MKKQKKSINPLRFLKFLNLRRMIMLKKPFFIFLLIAFFVSEMNLHINVYLSILIYIFLIALVFFDLEEYEFLNNSEKLLIFLTILPIARITEFFMDFGFLAKTAVFYFTLSFLIIYYTRNMKLNPGYTKAGLLFLPMSIIIGGVLGFIGNFYFRFAGTFELIYLLPFIVFSEELLFRGLIQNHAKKEFGSLFAIIFTSLLFAIFSLAYGFQFAYFMLMANLVICLIYNQTENIWLTLPINLLINLLLFILPAF